MNQPAKTRFDSSTERKTHWKKLINPDYIGAYALPAGEDMTVTIGSVAREMVTSVGGKKEECTVARLINQKPLILNVTNSKMIAKLYGPFIEDWAGKQIVLYASTTKMAGEVVECLRIRCGIPAEQAQSHPLSDERVTAAITAIKAGTYSRAQLEAYALTDAQKERLQELEVSE